MTGSAGTTLEVFKHPKEFPHEVRALFDQAEVADVELGATWYANLIDTVFGNTGGAVFYVLRESGAVRAALPLLRVSRAWGHELHSLGNFYTSRWAALLAPDAGTIELTTLLRMIAAQERGLIKFHFTPLDAQGPTTAALWAALRATGLIGFRHFRFKNWFTDGSASWPAYLATRKGKHRSDLKRMGAKLQEAGAVLSVVTGGDELEGAIEDFVRVYNSSWKQPEPFPGFIPALVRAAAARGWLRLGRIHLDGQAIAAQLWFVHAGRASIFKVAYDEAFKPYSPGSVCTALVMQCVMEQDGIGHIDYLIGDDAYKRIWMNQCRDRIAFDAFRRRHPFGLFCALREALAMHTKPWRDRLRRVATK